MVRLVVQEVRRHLLGYLGPVFYAMLLWERLGDGRLSAQWAVTLSMLIAILARLIVMDQPKELLVLPVSQTQLRHARWLFAIVMPAAVVATGKAVAMVIALWTATLINPDLGRLAVSGVCDLAYLGVAYAVFLLLPRASAVANRRLFGSGIALSFIAPLAAFSWGLLLPPYMPTQWADLAGLRGVAVMAGLGLVAGTYFYSPAVQTRMFRPVAEGDRQPRSSPLSRWIVALFFGAPGPAPPERSWLPTSAFASILRGVLPQCAIVPVLVGGLLLKMGDPFIRHSRGLFTAGWIALALVISQPNWSARLRQLRMLPMATWHLNAILLATPTAIWLSVWAAVALLHLGFPSRIADAFQPELIAGLIGVSALSDAYGLQSRWIRMGLTALTLLIVYLGLRNIGGEPAAVWQASALFGVAAVATAAWLNHHALTRSSSIYKPEKSALSFGR